jgi:hypothetical protein
VSFFDWIGFSGPERPVAGAAALMLVGAITGTGWIFWLGLIVFVFYAPSLVSLFQR